MRSLHGLVALAFIVVGCHPAPRPPARVDPGHGVLFLGHDAVLVEAGGTKVAVDPLFYDWPDVFQTVPTDLKRALFTGTAPFDGLRVVLITHSHGDHFSGRDLLHLLARQPEIRVYLPKQCYDRLAAERGVTPALLEHTIPIALAIGDAPRTFTDGALVIEAVRVPHIDIGRPEEVIENLAYRVTLGGAATFVHLGDAAPSRAALDAQRRFWTGRRADLVFAPFWFFTEGDVDPTRELNASAAVGLHVWPTPPSSLAGKRVPLLRRAGERCAITRCGLASER